MARNNVFLGTASGKVGDIVLMRRNGKQVARAYVSDINNPRTTGQSVQRNFFAPVTKFYSPLAEVLETSWEGKTRSESVSAFNQHNINLARSKGWYLPKGYGWFPLPYRVSKGTIPSLSYTISNGETCTIASVPASIFEETNGNMTVGAITQAFVNAGYHEGDQITVIAGIVDDDGLTDAYPIYGRFTLDASSTQLSSTIFDGMLRFGVTNLDSGITIDYDGTNSMFAIAVIVSRLSSRGVWQRSTQAMAVNSILMQYITGTDARDNAISSYGNNRSVALSNVYLNRSQRAPESVAHTVIDYAVTDGDYDDRVFGTAVPQSVEVGSDGLVVVAADAASGEVLRLSVANKVPSSVNFDHTLISKTAWSTSTGNGPSMFIPITSADDAAAQWLVQQGVSAALFT